MQPPNLPIQHSDAQWARYVSTQSLSPQLAVESSPVKPTGSLPVSAAIVLVFLSALSVIVYKKSRADSLHQRICRLEKLWQLESHSPFEEHQ